MAKTSTKSVLASARREAVFAISVWFVALVYSVGVCYWYGYGRKMEELTFVAGIPSWVFWGVVVPWLLCTVVTFYFSFFMVQDDDLEAESLIGKEFLADEAELES